MSTIQTLLTMGGILLLTFLILSFNKSVGAETSISFNNEAIITGTGIAASLFDEIQGKAFDETTVTASVSDPKNLSATLGTDAGETLRSQFDDVDDYNALALNDTLFKLGIFRLKTDIKYVTNMNPDVISLNQTFSKRINITVTNDYLTDTLKFTQVISY